MGDFPSCLLGEATNCKWIQNINVVVSQFYDPIVVAMFLKHFKQAVFSCTQNINGISNLFTLLRLDL